MFASFDPAESLRQRPALRALWIDQQLTLARSDARIVGVWSVGSIASGEADEWSDIDLIVACTPDLISGHRLLGRAAGSVSLEWDAPQNSTPGSMHYCVVYDLGPLPFGVDWHLWPYGSARPSDAKVLFERASSTQSDYSFEELQKHATALNKGRTLPEMPPDERRQFRLAMLYPICKDLARGWAQSSAMMVEWLGFEAPEQTAADWLNRLRAMLATLSAGSPATVRNKYDNLLAATEWALHQDEA